jgi:hypothetical protein
VTSKHQLPPEWPDAVLSVMRELAETIREPDRGERMRRLIEAATRHYQNAGEEEPEYIKTARRLFSGEGGANGDP